MTDSAASLGDRPSLLLVDDDESLCQALSHALAQRGFAVSVAHDADAAMRAARENPPEFAVVDLKMSGASGLTVVQALKALEAETRIVVLTGYASIATAVEAIKLGAMHYLAKPVDADEIVKAFGREGADPATAI